MNIFSIRRICLVLSFILFTLTGFSSGLLYGIAKKTKTQAGRVVDIPPSYISPCIKSSIDTLPTETLEEFVLHLKWHSSQDSTIQTAEEEIKRRKEAERWFYTTLQKKEEELIATAFTQLPFISREKCRPKLQEYLATLKTKTYRLLDIFVDEKQYQELCTLLNSEIDPEKLFQKASALLKRIKLRPDPMKQTAVAKAFEKASLLFIQAGKRERARTVLCFAEKNLTVSEIHPLYKLLTSRLLSQKSPLFISTGCDSIRRRQIEVFKKQINGKPTLELSFELTVIARKQFEKLLTRKFFSQVKTVPFEFIEKTAKRFSSVKSIKIDKAYKIPLSENVEMVVGNNSKYWNAYHHVRIQCKSGTSLQEIHRAFAALGLPTALMVSREEDRKKECLARILHLRFPQKSLLGDPVDPYKIYNTLSEKERQKVDDDLAQMKCTLVGPHHLEYVLPSFSRELKKAGAVCLGSYLTAGKTSNTANLLVSILQTGLLSSQARFQRGILSLGWVPTYNYKTGSANQAFARLFTEKQFSSEYKLSNFVLHKNVLILFDLQAMERLPYFYLHDRGGLRNPGYRQSLHRAKGQKPIKNFRGYKEIAVRPAPKMFVAKQEQSPHPLNEVMFDQALGSQYIRKIILENDKDRDEMLAILRKNGISDINGIPIEEAVVISSCLNPGLRSKL